MNPGIPRVLEILRLHYARDGVKHPLNDVQATIYAEELSKFSSENIEKAARQWIRQSPFFPSVSDLLGLLEPQMDPKAQAALAWAQVEHCMGSVGAYCGVEFADPCVGECVRQTFGSWPKACSFDYDSPGFAIRRQAFMALFPEFVKRNYRETVKLHGLHTNPHRPLYALIPHIVGLPEPRPALSAGPRALEDDDDSPIGPDEAKRLVADLHRRFEASKAAK